MKLESVSKPAGVALESAGAETQRKVSNGNTGTASDGLSRAARLLVTGKSDSPIKPPATGATLESVIANDDRTRILGNGDVTLAHDLRAAY